MEIPDEHLLERAAGGDAGAFDAFYRRHASAITTYFRRRVPTPELAFDLTAETFAAAVAGLWSFDSTRGSARGWLFGIVANEWRQAWRRGQVEDRARRQLALEPITLDDEALGVVERMTSNEALASAMAALSPAEAEAEGATSSTSGPRSSWRPSCAARRRSCASACPVGCDGCVERWG